MKGGRSGRTLLGGVVDGLFFLVTLINGEETRSREELHDETRGDDGGDTELHEGTTVGRHDDARPVPRIVFGARTDAVKGHLRAHQEDKQSDGGPQEFVFQGNLFKRDVRGLEAVLNSPDLD